MTLVRMLRCIAAALLASVVVGTGFAHDTESMEELTRAAERGNAESQFDLGFMYATGFGDFEADRAEALTWYRRAAEQGLAQAQSALGGTYARGDILEQDFTQAATWCQLWCLPPPAWQDDAKSGPRAHRRSPCPVLSGTPPGVAWPLRAATG